MNGKLETQLVCSGERWWISKAASLTEKAFVLRDAVTDEKFETFVMDITDIFAIPARQLVHSTCDRKEYHHFVIHTAVEDRGRLFRLDSREVRDEWVNALRDSLRRSKTERESKEWKEFSTYEKVLTSVEKVHKNPRTSIIMCGFVVLDFFFTCIDKQFNDEQLGMRGVEVPFFFFL